MNLRQALEQMRHQPIIPVYVEPGAPKACGSRVARVPSMLALFDGDVPQIGVIVERAIKECLQ